MIASGWMLVKRRETGRRRKGAKAQRIGFRLRILERIAQRQGQCLKSCARFKALSLSLREPCVKSLPRFNAKEFLNTLCSVSSLRLCASCLFRFTNFRLHTLLLFLLSNSLFHYPLFFAYVRIPQRLCALCGIQTC